MNTLTLKTAQPARHSNPTVKVTSLAYLLFERPDPDKAERFLTDFGLRTVHKTDNAIYMRALDRSPWCYRIVKAEAARFAGMGFTVSSREDLIALSRVPGASSILDLEAPGGGELVRLTDPSGLCIEIVHGRGEVAILPHRTPLLANHDTALSRVNSTQRPAVAPPEILKLGHVAIEVAEYQTTCAWYTRHLGMIPSDVQVLPDGSPGVSFLRLDLGDTPADHHTLALVQSFRTAYGHSAFEVVDVDAVGMGQRVLRERGWDHAWGMGRHILGSQIFDYWSDPWGAHHEHYCDGDVFTADSSVGVYPFSASAMAQWGQVMPASFVKPKLSFHLIKALLHSLRTVPDVTLRKLIFLARSIS